MNMLPNYILAFILFVFLIYSGIHIQKAKIQNTFLYGLAILITLLLLGMSLYGIFHFYAFGTGPIDSGESFFIKRNFKISQSKRKKPQCLAVKPRYLLSQ